VITPILLIGKPHSGKTTYLGQLILRIEANKSALKLYEPIENLTPIIEAMRSLSNGEEVIPTPTEKSTTIKLPLQYDGALINLDCPDYGGEQVNQIITGREVDSRWNESIKLSENWILFIKLNDLNTSFDLSNKTLKPELLEKNNGISTEYSISDQSSFIELFQILLHLKGQDAHFRNSLTKLTIVLTCWDELDNPNTPQEELQKCLPLFLNFIQANWIETNLKILGLSSLGLSLKEPENKIKYQETGSENFGFIVNSEGEKNDDLGQLILEAL